MFCFANKENLEGCYTCIEEEFLSEKLDNGNVLDVISMFRV